ncbi:MAG TPA: hypothetical protein PLL20_07520 [Phycisphaerae bacterium]|nr:hypothetical protein [Phycisphaerae bacterium]HRR86427.1 hypothetical protein [Phycisphaerae bacterium]
MGASKADSGSPAIQVPLRHRVLAVFTANVAVAFALAGWYGSEQYVLKINSSRVLEVDMLRLEIKILTTRPGFHPDDGIRREQERAALNEQIGTTFIIAQAWKWVMYLTAAILETTAIMIILGRRPLTAQIIASLAILVSTCCTVIAMHLLVRPDLGGMPSLPTRSYLYLALIQGGYGAVLLVVTLSQRKPAARQCLSTVP